MSLSLPFLTNLGLSQQEAEIYLILVEIGDAPVSRIAQHSTLLRANIYNILYALEEKQLIAKSDRKKIHFHALPPSQLELFASTHVQRVQEAQQLLTSTIPQLNNYYLTSTSKPVVTTYDNVEGVKQLYLDTLHDKQPIFALLQTHEVNKEIFKWLNQSYGFRRAKAGIHATVIAAASGDWIKTYIENDRFQERTTYIIPAQQFPFEHEINIYGEKVAIIQNKTGEHPLGIRIHHPIIAQTMKAWFDLALIAAKSLSNAQ